MAAYNIHKHFKGLRVQTARKRGRDPFATGFEDDSEDDNFNRRTKTKPKAQPVVPAADTLKSGTTTTTSRLPDTTASAIRDSEDEFLDPPKRQIREPSPAPVRLNGGRRGSVDRGSRRRKSATRAAVALAAGPLAYLDETDDSDEDQPTLPPPSRSDRYPSPAPRSHSDPDPPRLNPPRHTVASPFAGTKYLQDSETDGDDEEEAVVSRQGSADSAEAISSSPKKHLEVQRVDKPKSHGSEVSWRAFSVGRAEQRAAEITALQTSLERRGWSISFADFAATDDGARIRTATTPPKVAATARGRPNARRKSPPRRALHVNADGPEVDDGDDDREDHPDPSKNNIDAVAADDDVRSQASTSDNDMADSTDSILRRLAVSPQVIPEGRAVDHPISPIASPLNEPFDFISRNSSMRSLRNMASSRPARVPSSRRLSRRSTSLNTSASPAHAFLSSWSRDASSDQNAEPKPDDEGQSVGLDNEYIIGRTVNRGGFGVIKEVHSIDEHGQRAVRAVKIVRKSIAGKGERENDRAQQELEHEVSIWRHLKHRHVLDLIAVYETDYATFCIMDLNVGGTLFDAVRKARGDAAEKNGRKSLDAKRAKRYAYQLASALRYLHEDMRVCHRDVKLENCLIDMSGSNADSEGGNLRLCDFGLADFLHSDANADDPNDETDGSPASRSDAVITTSSVIGTLEYASPKGLSANRKLYETAGDVWAYGVIVYALCTGDLPFRHAMPSKTVELIMRADWDDTALLSAAAGSDSVIELVKGCLEKDIDFRLPIGEVLRNAWFEGYRENEEEQDDW